MKHVQFEYGETRNSEVILAFENMIDLFTVCIQSRGYCFPDKLYDCVALLLHVSCSPRSQHGSRTALDPGLASSAELE